MQLSVVILNYNVRWFLQQCLYSVEKATRNIDAEIIVVDNNSPDDSCDMVKRIFPNVVLIENRENSGFPKGNNIGVASAKGEFICILNPDTVVAEDTFQKAIAHYNSLSNPGIVGVKLIDGTGNFLPESKRGIPTPWTAFTKIGGLYKISPKLFGKYYASHLSPDQSGKIEIMVGAFMLMKTAHYREVGGFDESCFMYSDDFDLSYMILKSGRENHYYPGTTVIHYKGESTVRDEKYMKHFRDAMNFFYKKHFTSAPVFNIFMRLGSFAFMLAKKNKAVAMQKEISKYILVTKSPDIKEIENILSKPVELTSNLSKSTLSENTEIIFDTQTIDYKTVIETMQRFKGNKITFKNAYLADSFLIGSDSSDGRGEVMPIADKR